MQAAKSFNSLEPYQVFCLTERKKFENTYKNLRSGDITILLGKTWRSMTEQQKNFYKQTAFEYSSFGKCDDLIITTNNNQQAQKINGQIQIEATTKEKENNIHKSTFVPKLCVYSRRGSYNTISELSRRTLEEQTSM